MTFESILLFALVGVVATSVGVAWLISDHRLAVRTVESWRSTFDNGMRSLRQRLDVVEKQSPTALAAQVVELSEAVASLRAIQMRFQGRFDKRMQTENPQPLDRDALRRAHANDILPPGVKR